MVFRYTKTVEVDFPTVIKISDISDFIIDMLTGSLDYEVWGESEQEELFETITKEAYRYVAEELNKMVE